MSKDIKIGDLVEKVQSYHPAADVEVIRKAYEFSAKVHQGQKRAFGRALLDSSDGGGRHHYRS